MIGKISRKQYARMTDLMAEYVGNPCSVTDKAVTDYQEEIRWPFRATQEQLDDWNERAKVWTE